MFSYNNIIDKFHNKNICVIGDLILDQYIQGSVSRISPEAPVPVILQENSFYTPGGASNVANNLRNLGARVTIVGKIGDDIEGDLLKKELEKRRINIKGLFIDPGIYTSMKTRIIAQHQQVVRVDREKAVDSDNDTLNQRIWLFIERHISSFDAVIISDYGKGVISSALVRRVCTLAKRKKKIITVDPKVEHFEYYDKVTAITPNKKEVENAIRDIKVRGKRMLPINSDKLMTNKDIDRAGKELLKFLELDSLLITLGEHGMRLFENGKKPVSIKTSVREVYDVSGAGDTVIAVFTLSLTAGATKFQAADLANYAAGIVVGKIGAVSISKDELILAIRGGS